MKKTSLLLATLLMQAAVINSAYAQRDGAYAFDEGYGVRSALNYLPDGLTGKGVLVGVVDNGILFNHINFLDPNTFQTRVTEACVFDDSKPISAHTLEEMKKIQLNNNSEHGTHVAGVAAGSFAAEGWHGIAPEASLFLADADSRNEFLLVGIERAFAVADSLDMPMVLNLSAGYFNEYDGYNEVTSLFEKLTENGERPGRIITVSTGNSGKNRAYQESAIGSDGKARIPIQLDGSETGYQIMVSFKVLKDSDIDFRFFLYDTAAKKEVSSGMTSKEDGSPIDINDTKDEMLIKDQKDSPYKIYDYALFDEVLLAKDIVVGIEIIGQAGAKIGFATGLYSIEDDYFSPVRTVYGMPNEFCLTPAVISVGNCDSHYEGWPVMLSSSFGVNKYGDKLPDVVAPGCGIISSCKFYDPEDEYKRYGQRDVTMADGSTQTFNWRTMTGTSQSAPLVAGLCALMLEYDPTLTVNKIRELLYNTNDWTEVCDNAHMGPDQAGHGLLNTRALFEALMGPTAIEAVSAGVSDNSVYDLFGRRLKDMPAQGTFIRNGKVEIR